MCSKWYIDACNMCLEINRFDPAHVLSTLGSAWQAVLKNMKVKLDLLTDIDMFLMVEKDINGRICHTFHGYGKAGHKYMKNYDKNK